MGLDSYIIATNKNTDLFGNNLKEIINYEVAYYRKEHKIHKFFETLYLKEYPKSKREKLIKQFPECEIEINSFNCVYIKITRKRFDLFKKSFDDLFDIFDEEYKFRLSEIEVMEEILKQGYKLYYFAWF